MFRILTEPHITRDGSELITSYSPTSIGLWLGGSLAILLVGCLLLWKKKWPFGIPACFLGIVVLALVVPGVARAQVRVTEFSICQPTGLWFRQTDNRFSLEKLSLIEVRLEQRDRGSYEVWSFHYRDGRTEDFHPGELWRASTELIVTELAPRGIRVVRRPVT